MALLKEGDVIELNKNHTVYADVSKHIIPSREEDNFYHTNYKIKLDGKFSYFQGKYIVVKTELTGGGTGHGINDVYPDGHKVTCESLDGKLTVSFYQTGCFTAMIEDITPIGTATKKWIINP